MPFVKTPSAIKAFLRALGNQTPSFTDHSSITRLKPSSFVSVTLIYLYVLKRREERNHRVHAQEEKLRAYNILNFEKIS